MPQVPLSETDRDSTEGWFSVGRHDKSAESLEPCGTCCAEPVQGYFQVGGRCLVNTVNDAMLALRRKFDEAPMQ